MCQMNYVTCRRCKELYAKWFETCPMRYIDDSCTARPVHYLADLEEEDCRYCKVMSDMESLGVTNEGESDSKLVSGMETLNVSTECEKKRGKEQERAKKQDVKETMRTMSVLRDGRWLDVKLEAVDDQPSGAKADDGMEID